MIVLAILKATSPDECWVPGMIEVLLGHRVDVGLSVQYFMPLFYEMESLKVF